MSISGQSIAKSISVLGFKLEQEMHSKKLEGKDSRLAETDQQFQVEVTGEAGSEIAWTPTDLTFDQAIYIAPAQRQNPLEEPHFTFGYTMQSDAPVILHATVQKWTKDSSGNYTGATVNIGIDGRSKTPTPFKATVHMVFQGFSSPNYPVTGIGEG